MRPFQRGFASDNNAGIHPLVLDAIHRANLGHVVAYGDDPITQRAIAQVQSLFQNRVDVHFTFNGTAANVLGLKALTKPHHAILCAETAHISVDECGAPENFTGCKLLTIATPDGKLTPSLVMSKMTGVGDQHHVQPRVISITQSTELGTVYRPDEIRALATLAHSRGLSLHMDGARIANAVVSLGVPLAAMTEAAGVDVLSFGGTKNGLLCGEAVVFFDRAAAEDFRFIRKQGMGLASKMRFLSAQFEAILTDDLWLKNAAHANRMARQLAAAVECIPGLRLSRPVEANAVFCILPSAIIPKLQAEYFFYVWSEATSEVRWVTSFDTTAEDIEGFTKLLQDLAR